MRLPGSPKRKRRYRTRGQGAISRATPDLESEIVAFIPGYVVVDVVRTKGKRALLASGAWVSLKVLDVLKGPSRKELEQFELEEAANVERVEVRRPMTASRDRRPHLRCRPLERAARR